MTYFQKICGKKLLQMTYFKIICGKNLLRETETEDKIFG